MSEKTWIGKEDFAIDNTADYPQTYAKSTEKGGVIYVLRLPDVWNGHGLLNIGAVTTRALDDNNTILHSFGKQQVIATGDYLTDVDGNIIYDTDGNPIEIQGV